MANYETIVRLRPSFSEFVLHKRLKHRGDVLGFPRNYRSDAFSTDARGFRHTSFAGESLSLTDIAKRDRYALVLGGSRSFGLGLAGNENALPSLLSERFGIPFANVALPQGNSRNLSSLLTAIIARAPKPPVAVVHYTGGDFTGFAYSSIADPVFGSPNPKQVKIVGQERGGLPPAEQSIRALLAFTSLWTRSIAITCKVSKAPLVLANDTSFFEKVKPSKRDRECELGKAFHPAEERWFANQKTFGSQFYERREALAADLGIPLAGPGARNNVGFIDEFHLDEEGTKAFAEDIAAALEPLIRR